MNKKMILLNWLVIIIFMIINEIFGIEPFSFLLGVICMGTLYIIKMMVDDE